MRKFLVFVVVIIFPVVTARKFKDLNIPSCPTGCTCLNVRCKLPVSNNLRCQKVAVACREGNVSQRLDELPENATDIFITKDNFGHTDMDIFAKRFLQLRTLMLPEDSIRSLSLSLSMKKLKVLVLDHNKLCFLPVRGLELYSSLEMLSVKNNSLTFISDIAFPSSLTDLDLRCNQVESPRSNSFRRLNKLITLKLEFNAITEIKPSAFRHMVSLETLTLDNNKIRMIPNNFFRNFKGISYVSLTNNRINKIDGYAFKQIGVKYHGMHEIHLENNQLSELNLSSIERFLDRKLLYSLFFAGNPFDCNCKLSSVLSQMMPVIKDSAQASCSSPQELRGTKINALDLPDCEYYLPDDFYYSEFIDGYGDSFYDDS